MSPRKTTPPDGERDGEPDGAAPDAAGPENAAADAAAAADTVASDTHAGTRPPRPGPLAEPAADELADVAGLGYEQARDELARIVSGLEGGQVPLEESMRLWRRGEALAAHCTAWLDGAQRQVEAATGQTD